MVVVGGVFVLLVLFLLIYGARWTLLAPDSSPELTSSFQYSTAQLESQRELLKQATTYLKENQASSFNRAIQEVGKIPLSSPVYQEAQEKMARWSEMILDIAQGRAKQGNFQDAIAAAKLVPPQQKQVYNAALKAIETWQVQVKQQQVNQALIDGAKALIQPALASSYNQGITILRQIRSSEPGYKQAQELIEQWSQKIYRLANSRAKQGDYQSAIATAKLVPAGTSAHQMAKNALAKWQAKLD